MDFGDDDVLGDILSDGSNDSFFDEPKFKTKTSAPSKIPAEAKKETKQDDWLEISNKVDVSKLPDSKGKIDWLGLDKKETIETDRGEPFQRNKKTTKKISFEDDDILGTLGFSEKVKRGENSLIQEPRDKKTDMLESILKSNTKEKPLDNVPKMDSDTAKSSSGGYLASASSSHPDALGVPREGRRKRVTSGLVDPLGLFSDQLKEESRGQIGDTDGKYTRARSFSSGDGKDIDAMSSTKSHIGDTRSVPNLLEAQGTPDWLGLVSKPKTSDSDRPASSYTKHKSDVTLSDKTDSAGYLGKPVDKTQTGVDLAQTNFESSGSQTAMSNALMAHEKLAKSQMEFQSAAVSLQKQESQILIALQMKRYEDSLMEIQRQQQEILVKQDQQFSALLERQFAKQHAMEDSLKLQQERINNHIQVLLSQPRVEGPISHLKTEIEKTKENTEEEYLKANDSLLNNLKQRHHEELFVLEESYKKQISVLEDSSQQVESRLKAELETVLSRNVEIISSLKENHEKELEAMRKKYGDVEKRHVEELKLIRDNHLRVIDEMKYEHNLLLENLKESRRQESSITKESGDFGKMLDANIQLLHNNSQILQNVSGKVETQYGVVYTTREETLKAKEKEIEMMRTTLEKCRESAESERTHLIGLVGSLETKIAELHQTTREERWAMQQAVSTLAARSAAFDRETEFSRASIEREREQLKNLKESLLAEQEKILLQLTEEKLTISAEKSRLQTTSKLNIQFDTQKAKAELEAAIQVAKEAAEMTDRERDTLHRRIAEVESLKRVLKDKERNLISKEDEVNELMHASEQRYQDGERALKDAKMTETKYNEKMRLLQVQMLQLSAREKKISEEQIALSKERLALSTSMRQKQNCKLCSVDNLRNNEQRSDWTNEFNNEDINIPPRFDVTEAEIFRLQFEDKSEEPRNTSKYI